MPNVVVFALDAAALIAHVGVATRTQSPGAHGRCRTLQSLKLNIGVRKNFSNNIPWSSAYGYYYNIHLNAIQAPMLHVKEKD